MWRPALLPLRPRLLMQPLTRHIDSFRMRKYGLAGKVLCNDAVAIYIYIYIITFACERDDPQPSVRWLQYRMNLRALTWGNFENNACCILMGPLVVSLMAVAAQAGHSACGYGLQNRRVGYSCHPCPLLQLKLDCQTFRKPCPGFRRLPLPGLSLSREFRMRNHSYI